MNYKILLLDDDSDDRMFFKDAIKKVGNGDVSCITLADGHELIATLQGEPDSKPHIIFLDINMPGMSGWEVLSLLKEHEDYANIPAIMYSTSKHNDEIRKAKALGALYFFNKPSDFGVLKETLKVVIEHLRSNNIHQLSHASNLFI